MHRAIDCEATITFEDGETFSALADISFRYAVYGWVGTGTLLSTDAGKMVLKEGYAILECHGCRIHIVIVAPVTEDTIKVLTPGS